MLQYQPPVRGLSCRRPTTNARLLSTARGGTLLEHGGGPWVCATNVSTLPHHAKRSRVYILLLLGQHLHPLQQRRRDLGVEILPHRRPVGRRLGRHCVARVGVRRGRARPCCRRCALRLAAAGVRVAHWGAGAARRGRGCVARRCRRR